ncbi:hypothetical protein SPONL_2199 [uncultured Candidatus Thioglobus sp.]|nr:hypothetical protein SPONL_2199 [uncultured Candidatus Thioglobus sp.]
MEAENLPIALRRGKRNLREVNYRAAESLKLPRASSSLVKDKLYPVTVLEQDSDRVKVHYVGYSSEHDEWKYGGELEDLEPEEGPATCSVYQPYSLYSNLRIKVKQALTCGRKSSPLVKIVMAFDLVQFSGGLQTVGVPSKKVQGVQHYQIKNYKDLNPWLGSYWHFRGLNANGDYGFVELETIDFCIRRSRSLVEYLPPSDHQLTPCKLSTDTGFSLSFCFVCNYGTAATFGKDKNIFD